MTLYRFLLTVITALAQLALPSHAETVLRVLINDVAPYTLHDDPQHPGMHADMVNALARRAGVSVEMQSVPYVRLADGIRRGSADLVVGVEGPELESLARRVVPFHVFKFVVISKNDTGINSVADLRGHLLGVARGAFYDESINNDPGINKYQMKDPFQGVRMLAADRLDAVISSDYLLTYALKQAGLSKADFSRPFVVNERSYVLYASKQLPDEVVKRLQDGMAQLHKSGQIAEILHRYQ